MAYIQHYLLPEIRIPHHILLPYYNFNLIKQKNEPSTWRHKKIFLCKHVAHFLAESMLPDRHVFTFSTTFVEYL